MTEQKQDYKTHRRWVPLYHFVLSVLILALLVASGYWLYQAADDRLEALVALGTALALALLFYYTRGFALRAQDRAIRAEENLRHFVLHGTLLDPRLTPRQIIGLRFASDAELGPLAQKAAEEGLSEEAIKKSVRDWRGDFYRV